MFNVSVWSEDTWKYVISHIIHAQFPLSDNIIVNRVQSSEGITKASTFAAQLAYYILDIVNCQHKTTYITNFPPE